MSSLSNKGFEAGKRPSLKKLNEMVDATRMFSNINSDDFSLVETPKSYSLSNKKISYFYAKITGGSNPYAWSEVYPGAGGTFSVVTDGRTGTTTDNPAYELNGKSVPVNKIVKLYQGVQGEWLFEYHPKGTSCGGGTINVDAPCATSGVLFELLDAAGTTVISTQTGSSASFSVTGTDSYKIRVSKTGYHTKTSGTISPGCGGTVTTSVTTWPISYSVTIHAEMLSGCPIEGASVSISGDGSGSGTTDSGGNVTISLSSSSTSSNQSLNYTITPPSGTGIETKTGSITAGSCGTSTHNFILGPSSGHCIVECNYKYMPLDMEWEDDYGSCTISFGGNYWSGSYIYESSHCIDLAICDGFPFEQPYSEQTGFVEVFVRLSGSQIDCETTRFKCSRGLFLAVGSKCDPLSPTTITKCQPVTNEALLWMNDVAGDDIYASWDGGAWELPLHEGTVGGTEYSCGSSVEIECSTSSACDDIELSPCNCNTGSFVYDETSTNITITGIIS